MKKIACSICILWSGILAGCGGATKQPGQLIAVDIAGKKHTVQLPADSPRDALQPSTTLFQVEVYQLTVPMGSFSSNEEFWKRMDEQCVDQSTYDVLYRNGIRVGEASSSELSFFKQFMDNQPMMSKLTTTAAEAQKIELPVAKDLPQQTLAMFDLKNTLTMRDFDGSTNILNFSFQAAPRKPGTLRVKLCPMVRSNRRHYEWTALGNENNIQFVASEMLYDLNLVADIAPDHFLIIMPSPDAKGVMSVGHAFLTKQAPTELQERIILIVSRPIASVPNAQE